jgi:hypothetical protein
LSPTKNKKEAMTEAIRKYVTLLQAENKYREARDATYRATVMFFRSADDGKFSHLTVTAITTRAVEAYETQWNQSARLVSWDWGRQVELWRAKRPSYWEMAVWHKQKLCGLVVGGPSRRRKRLYVEGIEANPEENPLKTNIIPVALLAAEQYAVAIGCNEVWLVCPPDELFPIYEKTGYNIRLPSFFAAKILRRNRYAIKKIGV